MQQYRSIRLRVSGSTKFEVWLAIHGFAHCILRRRTKINTLCE